MLKFAGRAAILAALTVVLFGCVQQGTEGTKLAAGQKLLIAKEVWADYQEYLRRGRSLGDSEIGF